MISKLSCNIAILDEVSFVGFRAMTSFHVHTMHVAGAHPFLVSEASKQNSVGGAQECKGSRTFSASLACALGVDRQWQF